MNRFNRSFACALTLLVAAATFVPAARAGEFDLWDLTGTDLVGGTSPRGGTDDLWDIIGTQVVLKTNQVQFKELGIILSVTPTVSGNTVRAEPLFLLEREGISLNVGTARNPRWEPLSETEFQMLIAELEQGGFGLIADVYEEGRLIVQFVLFY